MDNVDGDFDDDKIENEYDDKVDFNEIEKSRKKFITAQKTQICAEC